MDFELEFCLFEFLLVRFTVQFMGFVEKTGDKVNDIKVGDRVVCAFDLGCGCCM